MTLATYTLRVLREDGITPPSLFTPQEEDRRMLANLPAMLEAVEEDLSKLLPEGYRAIITREGLT